MRTEVGGNNLVSTAEEFRQKFYSKTTDLQWNNWRWQLANSIKTISHLEQFLEITEDEINSQGLPLRITPYYLSLIYNSRELRKTMVPTINELKTSFGEMIDPLEEEKDSPVPGLIHRYPDRVLLLATDFCSANCRYCTRSRIIDNGVEKINYNNILAYIAEHTEIRDVVVSGGDPLTLTDDRIENLLKELRGIPHVEIIRIGTKVPFVLPQRITDNLVNILKKYHPLYISIHSTHPAEITNESKLAISKLADAGIVLGSQTVLLSGVNNDSKTLMDLFHGLLKMRVRPYYLYQCDPILGSNHFKTTIKEGLNIIQSMRGFTSGYAIPQYVIDAPGGGGKIPILPDSVVSIDEQFIHLKNYENKIFKYPI